MSVRTTLVQISVGMMLTMTAASSSLAQRIEPIAATLRMLTTEGNSTQQMHDASQQVPRREPMNAWRGTAGGLLGGGPAW